MRIFFDAKLPNVKRKIIYKTPTISCVDVTLSTRNIKKQTELNRRIKILQHSIEKVSVQVSVSWRITWYDMI
ncbi:hypothetical protein T07_11782 [Trichinella nelsoni]|uniref:Uncharacterized protein n=1 Tax=Trichinella nelsoni TaxID=6336 RepID=A0A0V0RL10_9BILA|nr:hypothetical protein T07_11782 [Trichinella nelsoni]